jgi:AHBA synthesis associated protein
VTPLTTVVFDLDGVLVDSIEVMREAFQNAYDEIVGQGPAPFEEYLPHLGRHMPEILNIMGLPAEMYPAFVRYSAKLLHRVPMSPGADILLDQLRAAGIRIGVATGKSKDRAEEVLQHAGLLDRVDTVCGSDEVVLGKPAPDIVVLALRRLGSQPSQAVMVGDSVLDLMAGRAAGTRVAAALWGQGSTTELMSWRPEVVSASCHELSDQLAAIIYAGS